MNKFFLVFCLFLVFSCANNQPPEEDATTKPPNIIFIMTDDHAEQAISAYGSDFIQTPNIDRIAREGIRFENSFVTNSICAPSRAVLLTGKYSHLNGLRDNRDRFDGSQQTFPKLLQQAGYYTSIVGKWHLKTAPTGFDDWNILIGQGEYYNPRMIKNGDTTDHVGYTTDLITNFAIESLEKRDTNQPFCLLYHHKAPHRNWMPHPRHFDLYKDQDIPLPETFYDDYSNRAAAAKEQDMRIDDMFLSMDMKLHADYYGEETGTGGQAAFNVGPIWENMYNRLTPEQKAAWDAHYDPINEEFKASNLSGKELLEWKYQRYMKDYLRCVVAVDENIGRMLKYLEDKGLSENTLVVYTSDQGFYLGEHGWYDKRFMYEESLSMPLVMRYPQSIPAGQVNEDIVLNLDFAPTLLDYAGVDIPANMQGRSLKPVVEGNTPDDWRTSMYYQYYEYPHGWHLVKKHYGVRTDRYKLIHYYNDIDEWELFDLQNDPNELKNLYNEPAFAAIQDSLHSELTRLREKYQVVSDE